MSRGIELSHEWHKRVTGIVITKLSVEQEKRTKIVRLNDEVNNGYKFTITLEPGKSLVIHDDLVDLEVLRVSRLDSLPVEFSLLLNSRNDGKEVKSMNLSEFSFFTLKIQSKRQDVHVTPLSIKDIYYYALLKVNNSKPPDGVLSLWNKAHLPTLFNQYQDNLSKISKEKPDRQREAVKQTFEGKILVPLGFTPHIVIETKSKVWVLFLANRIRKKLRSVRQ